MLVGTTAQTNGTTNTNQQGTAEDSTLNPERTAERAGVLGRAQRTRTVAEELSRFTSARRNGLLLAAADVLVVNTEEILVANTKDVGAGKAYGFSDSLLDRLRLNATRVGGIAGGLRQVAALPDLVGETLRGNTLSDDIKLSQVSIPLGVMGVVYEARPNTIVDASSLALKSDNMALLRGSKSAIHSSTQLIAVLRRVLANHNTPGDLVQLLLCEIHNSMQGLITARGLVDTVVPHGGAGLVEAVVTKVTVPTTEAGTGDCHICIDASADIDEAIVLMIDGKTRRPNVCNATETVLIGLALSAQGQVHISDVFADAGVVVHGDVDNPATSGWTDEVIPATAEDQSDKYLSLDTAVHTIDGMVAAIDHITEYSSDHMEVISARDWGMYQKFIDRVDAATVSVDASTTFTDGEQCGFGAEISISTQKLYVRGPTGLPELTSNKQALAGRGQTRL